MTLHVNPGNKNSGRILLIPVLFFSLFMAAYSQDMIITNNNDTIDCKITRISRNTVYFDVFTSGIRTAGSIPLSNVRNYAISATGIPDYVKIPASTSTSRFRIGINAGAGYLTAGSGKAEEALVNQGLEASKAKSYYKNLKTGWSAGADLSYMITTDLGTGIKYKFFYTSGNVDGFFDPQDGVHLIYGSYGERIFINYYGALFSYQQYFGSAEEFRFYSGYSLGMVTYRNEAEYISSFYLLTGKNFGTEGTIGLEYYLTDHLSAGADLSAFYSSLRKIRMTDGTNTTTIDLDKENYENLTRFELSLGLRFYF